MNNNTFEKLQYNDLKEKVKSYCISSLGKELIDKLNPSYNIKLVERRLKETSEGVSILDVSGHIPLEGISNIKSIIDSIDKGIIVEPKDLLSVMDFFRGCRKIKRFLEDKGFYAKTLSTYGDSIYEFLSIEEAIETSISGSMVNSNASKTLSKIRRNIDTCEGKIQVKLEKFLQSSENKKYIQEFFISKRNDRYTIPIKASYKNQVSGTIIEVSSKGSTVFIEPSTIGKYTVELAILKSEESVEEYRILSELSNLIFEKIKEIKINIELIAELDMIFAKAKYSKSINGIKPQINGGGYIKIVDGCHPLLPNNPVPLNFEIGQDYRSLTITGPNAGGKTIVLKTIGILTLAVQSGFHIEAREGTTLSVFEKVFVDIGDNQSLENSLSTFSSHMKNLSHIVDNCNKSTLILCDEIGSGTEPNEGAGIAIAILEEFYKKGAITVSSTHYGEIKNFSELHPHFENAAMQFEKETLKPLYKLLIGRSGNSNALWISAKMGISPKLLERAEKYIYTKDYNLDLINSNKSKSIENFTEETLENKKIYNFEKGDTVILLDHNKDGIVFKSEDKFNNVVVFFNNDYIEVNSSRLKLKLKAMELYPEDYDLDTLFISYKERKLEHDIQRGSKKALKKIQKEIKNQKF